MSRALPSYCRAAHTQSPGPPQPLSGGQPPPKQHQAGLSLAARGAAPSGREGAQPTDLAFQSNVVRGKTRRKGGPGVSGNSHHDRLNTNDYNKRSLLRCRRSPFLLMAEAIDPRRLSKEVKNRGGRTSKRTLRVNTAYDV